MNDRVTEGCAIGLHPWGKWQEVHGQHRRECVACGKVVVSARDPEPPSRAVYNPYADL